MYNAPNLLSLARLLATFLIFVLVLINMPWAFLAATGFFLLASITDFLDGYIARRFHIGSTIGIFLDLTADKIFVSAILLAFVQLSLVPAWLVVIIIAREFIVTGLRSMAAAKGTVIPAGAWGKQKTFITLVAMGGILLAKGLGAGMGGHQLSLFPPMLVFNSSTVTAGNILLLVADALLLLATLWTVISGADYTIRALPLLQSKEETATPKPETTSVSSQR
jgi:CDP-diacylglycerol---glycerol-3-phosphate 3-phosphatidyltransferase